MKHLLPLTFLLTACSTVYTRPEDAGVDADEDAITIDAPPDAWVVPDAFTPDSSEPDAFNVPDESCNGIDDDFDGIIDENNPRGCGETYVCAAGVCRCREGFYACGSPMPGLCDVSDVTTREHCGGCAPCGAAEDCSTEGGTPHCVPARIVDFTAESEESGITCIIREEDSHLVCRDGTGWRDTERVAASVRAWRGTICYVSEWIRGHVYCGGSNATGLRLGDAAGAWTRLPFRGPDTEAHFSIEGGEGVIVAGYEAFVWGPLGFGRHRYLSGDAFDTLGDGTRRFVVTQYNDRVTGGWALTLRTWGAPFPPLSDTPWTDYTGGAGIRTIETVDTGIDPGMGHLLSCYRNYCCIASEGDLRCWGGTGAEPRLVRVNAEHAVGRLRVFPTPEGIRVCFGSSCMQLNELHDAVAPRLEYDPRAREGHYSRADWRGDCFRNEAGGFTCHGMHSGWPEP